MIQWIVQQITEFNVLMFMAIIIFNTALSRRKYAENVKRTITRTL